MDEISDVEHNARQAALALLALGEYFESRDLESERTPRELAELGALCAARVLDWIQALPEVPSGGPRSAAGRRSRCALGGAQVRELPVPVQRQPGDPGE